MKAATTVLAGLVCAGLVAAAQAQPVSGPAGAVSAEQVNERVRLRIETREELWRQRDQAQSELDAAQAAKANGVEPLPGERSGLAGGGARLNQAYWDRQKMLEQAVERAQRNLERAQQRLRDAG